MSRVEKIAEELLEEAAQKEANDPGIRKSIHITELFMKQHPVLCYGGTAINNLLPKEDQFYDFTKEIPDYDFFSKTPQEHAVMLANRLERAGIINIEVKPGMHLGTFKVFANYEAIADITELNSTIFDRLWKENIVKENIHYVTPDFLRMSMYLELSRPNGDVSRWGKVYKRLTLLNKQYPITCPTDDKETKLLTPEQQSQIESFLKKEPVVLLGLTATEVHTKSTENWHTPITLLADRDVIERLVAGEKTKVTAETDILPTTTIVLDSAGDPFIFFFETTACHSYHAMKNGVRIASIPTTLQFFFAYLYSGVPASQISTILCVGQRLIDISNKKSKRKFEILTPKECLGHQETLKDIKASKAEAYVKLSENEESVDFVRFFFKYNPHDIAKRKRVQKVLKKTRKARLSKPTWSVFETLIETS